MFTLSHSAEFELCGVHSWLFLVLLCCFVLPGEQEELFALGNDVNETNSL
jgi:hypothetical protein